MTMRAGFLGLVGLVLATLSGACSGKDENRNENDSGGSGGSSTGAGATAASGGGRAGSSTGGSGATSPAERQALLDFYRVLYVARCNFDQRCTAENGHAYVNMDACLANVDYTMAIIERAIQTLGIWSYLSITPGGDYQACAESVYPTDTCDEPSTDTLSPACQSVFTFVNPIAIGGVCHAQGTSSGVCELGNRCVIEDGCGRCEARPNLADGAPCTSSNECAGERCIDDLCASPRPRGAACSSAGDCRGYLRCVGELGAAVCEDAQDEGDTCAYDSECVNGLSCLGEPALCTLDAPEGTACDRTGAVSCGFQCVFAAAEAPNGECGAALPMVGEPCAYSGSNPLCGEGYAKRTVDAGGLDTSCVCAPRELGGGPCRASSDCQSYSCTGDDFQDPTVLGTCDPLAPNDAECALDESCESGICNPDGLCAAAPVCQ